MTAHKTIVKAVNEAFRKAELNEFLNHCCDDIHWRIIGDQEAHGLENVKSMLDKMGPSKLKSLEVEDMIEENGQVCCRGHLVTDNPLQQNSRFHFADFYTFRDNKILELTSFVIETAIISSDQNE